MIPVTYGAVDNFFMKPVIPVAKLWGWLTGNKPGEFAAQLGLLLGDLSQHLLERGLRGGIAVDAEAEGSVTGIVVEAIGENFEDPGITDVEAGEQEADIAVGCFAEFFVEVEQGFDGAGALANDGFGELIVGFALERFQDFDVVGERFRNVQRVEEVNEDAVKVAGFAGLREGENFGSGGRSVIEDRVEPSVVDGGTARRGSS